MGLFKKGPSPDYARILAKTNREMVIVVRRIIQHEKLQLEQVYQLEGRQTYDVVLLTDSRLLIVRHFYGTTKASFQEFERDKWELLTDPEQPNIQQFLTRYSEEVQQLDQAWTFRKEVGGQ